MAKFVIEAYLDGEKRKGWMRLSNDTIKKDGKHSFGNDFRTARRALDCITDLAHAGHAQKMRVIRPDGNRAVHVVSSATMEELYNNYRGAGVTPVELPKAEDAAVDLGS